MSLHSRTAFEAFASSLSGTTLVEQWDSLVAKVGGKVFCLLSNGGSISFKVSETSFEGLTALDGVGQAPYFARGQWVAVEPEALEDQTLRAYLQQAHRLIAAKLTRKARAELGL